MNRPLRIAFLLGSFPMVSETFILRQITGLLDLGHEVDIFADTRAPADMPVQPEVAEYRLLDRTTFMDMPHETAPWEMSVRPLTGVTWIPATDRSVRNFVRVARAAPKFVRCLALRPRLTRQVLRRSEYGFQAESLSMLYRLSKLLGHRGGYDVLHAHFGPNGNSFRFARELWRAPLIVSFHGYDFSTLPRQRGPDMYRKLFATADLVTVNSEFTRRRVELLGCPQQKLQRLPVGLDLETFPFHERNWNPGEPLRLITVARLVEIKGLEFALRAVARARGNWPTLQYDIVGDGPFRGRLEILRQVLGLQAAVRIHGARDSSFIRELMAAAHLALLTSVNVEGDAEGQGLFLQEAQACGLPVVATQHGALPEGLAPGQSGFLVPEGDVEALSERLRFLIQHHDQWPAMGRAGRTLVEARYDIRKLNRELVELYAAAIEEYLARAPETNHGS